MTVKHVMEDSMREKGVGVFETIVPKPPKVEEGEKPKAKPAKKAEK